MSNAYRRSMNPRGSVGSSVGAWTISGGIHRFAMGTRKGSSKAIMNVLYITKYFMSMNNPCVFWRGDFLNPDAKLHRIKSEGETPSAQPAGCRRYGVGRRRLNAIGALRDAKAGSVLRVVHVAAAYVRFAFGPDGIEVSRRVGHGLGVVAVGVVETGGGLV